MAVAHRVSRRYLDQRTARQVVARLVWAMSRDQAKRVLKLPDNPEPSETDINRAYRALVTQAIRENPGAAADQTALTELNIAKDTLRGQFDRHRREGPNAPEPSTPPNSRTRERPREEEAPPPDPPPVPPGDPFTVMFHSLGNVDWKIATGGAHKSEYIVESEGPPRKGYWLESDDIILVGKTDTHYIFAKITRRHSSRQDHRDKTFFVRWEGFKMARPIDAHDLMKLAPKVIKGMREGAHGVAKFSVLEGTITEENIQKQVRRTRLSFPDAALGSGLLAEGGAEAPTDRKLQIELEPIQNREKWKAVKDSGAVGKWYRGYDWFVHVNGKKTQLNEDEVEGLERTYILSGVFGYDFKKKINLTRLRGGRMKYGPKDALEQLAKALHPGPLRETVLKAAQAFA